MFYDIPDVSPFCAKSKDLMPSLNSVPTIFRKTITNEKKNEGQSEIQRN